MKWGTVIFLLLSIGPGSIARGACECPADLDGSGHVGFPDLTSLLMKWGPCDPPCPADLDATGAVAFSDLSVLLAKWGACPSSLDGDGDGIPDCLDLCPGDDDTLDTDLDGTPDCLDLCPGDDDTLDTDLDGIPDCLDLCPGVDDTADTDLDGIPDCLDLCPGVDDTLDTDLDGTPDCLDLCPGDDDTLDTDLDGTPDCLDLCPGDDDTLDTDLDGTPDCLDLCPGDDDTLDTDLDGTPDCLDLCPGDDDTLDTDLDGIPDCLDLCPGDDDTLDTDLDGIPDCLDLCPGDDDTLDTDLDGTPDCLDLCPGDDDTLDTDLDGTPDCLDLCPGVDDTLDTDLDGTPDCLDLCPGDDDTLDTDLDGTPDCLDLCPGDDDTLDTDLDGTPDCLDLCPGVDDTADTDLDGIPDCLDLCPGVDDTLDTDLDGIPDCLDLCPGVDDTLDTDLDGTPDCLDDCPDDPAKIEPGACGCGVEETDPCVGLSGLRSDDFNRFNLDGGVWTFIDPVGDSDLAITGVNTPAAAVNIILPEGAHGLFAPNNAARLTQAVNDVDLDVVARFLSVPTMYLQAQGLLIEQDESNSVMFIIYHNGSALRLFVATTSNGVVSVALDQLIFSMAEYLRVERVGDEWFSQHSYDGIEWETASTLTLPMVANTVSLLAANDGPGAPAYTAVVDFFDVADGSIVEEDGNTSVVNDTPPFLYHVTTEAFADGEDRIIEVRWESDEPAGATVRYGLTTGYELGTLEDPALADAHCLFIAGLEQPATYEIRLEADDVAGNLATIDATVPVDISGAPTIDVWYGDQQAFGHLGIPQTWINVLGNASDPDDIASLTYSLNDGPIRSLTLGSDLQRLYGSGDFNAEIAFTAMQPGTHEIVIRADDEAGNGAISFVDVECIQDAEWPLPYEVDWDSLSSLQDAVQVIDGRWSLVPGGVRSVEPGYDRLIAIGDLTWENYEVTVPITIHGIDLAGFLPPSYSPGLGILLRWTGHTADGNQPSLDYLPFGAITWFRWFNENGALPEIMLPPNVNGDFITSVPLQYETTYVFKAQATSTTVDNATRSLYRFKLWLAGENEPDWQMQAIGEPDGLLGGSLLLIAHHVDATYGNVTVVPIPAE